MHNNTKLQASRQYKIIKVFAIIVFAFAIILPLLFQQNVFADSSDVVETNFFGNIKDDNEGCGVYTILNLVINILSIGIGLLAVIGVTIVGIQYLTAKDSTEQTKKAKNRMLELVIGLIVYAVLYAGVQFLLPGGLLNNTSCSTISDEELAQIKADEEAKKTETKSSTSSSSKTKKTEKTKETDLSKWFNAMKKQLDYMKNAKYGANYKSDFSRSKTDGTCITYVSTSLQRLGVIPKNTYVWVGQSGKLTGTAKDHIKKHKNTFDVFYPHKSVKQLKNTLKVGDIVGWNPNNGNHIMVFMGFNKKGNPIFNSWGSQGGKYKKEYSYYANRKVDMVIRLKKTSL